MSVSRSLTFMSGNDPNRSATAMRKIAVRWNTRIASSIASTSRRAPCVARSSSAASSSRDGGVSNTRASSSSSSNIGCSAIWRASNELPDDEREQADPERPGSRSRARGRRCAGRRRETPAARARSNFSAARALRQRLERPNHDGAQSLPADLVHALVETAVPQVLQQSRAPARRPRAVCPRASRPRRRSATRPRADPLLTLGPAAPKPRAGTPLRRLPAGASGAHGTPPSSARFSAYASRARSSSSAGNSCVCARSWLECGSRAVRRYRYAAVERSRPCSAAAAGRRRGAARRVQQRARPQLRPAAAAHDLKRLHDELDLADAAGAELDVLGQVLARDLLGDEALHLPSASNTP